MIILNLTQHPASPEQIAAGVVDLQGDDLAYLKRLLTFDEPPTTREILDRAVDIASLAILQNKQWVMIGGAPFFMSALERALTRCRIGCLYAFTQRVVETDQNGRKVSYFKHAGWVQAIWKTLP